MTYKTTRGDLFGKGGVRNFYEAPDSAKTTGGVVEILSASSKHLVDYQFLEPLLNPKP